MCKVKNMLNWLCEKYYKTDEKIKCGKYFETKRI